MSFDLRSKVLLASAGTGKTFQLSNRYLALVLHGVDLDQMLATTFTRKAAGEILNSILNRLATACANPDACEELREFLHLPQTWGQAEATQLLQKLLSQLPQFQVGTLDSWFQSQVRAGAFELGLPLGWKLAERYDENYLHAEAVAKSLLQKPVGKLLPLLQALDNGQPKRSILRAATEQLKDAARLWQESDEDATAWDLLANIHPPSEELYEKAAAALENLEIPKGKNGKLNQNWVKAKAKALAAVQEKQWEELGQVSLIYKAIQGEESFSRHPIPLLQIMPVVKVVAKLELCKLHKKNCAIRDLAKEYQTVYQQDKDRAGILEFQDFPNKLACCSAELQQAIAQRTGGAPKHLLIDEFQDTNVEQWKALQPIIEPAIEAEKQGRDGSAFFVGDAKQSIYGFREGEPRLLTNLSNWYQLPKETMAKNYRSSQVILDAVNSTFSKLHVCSNPESPVIQQAIKPWLDFPEHQAGRQRRGVVRVLEVQGEKANIKADNINAVLSRVEHLYQQNPTQSMGVLVRKNNLATELIARLSAKGIRACSAGGNELIDSQAVDIALSLFQLAAHPGDTEAWFHIASSPLAICFDKSFRPGETMQQDAARFSSYLRHRLVYEGYGNFLEDVLQKMREHQAFDPWNLHRFAQLVELGHSWDSRGELRYSQFVEMVKAEKVVPADAGLVQVMTIHQAKGLDFDIVVFLLDGSAKRPNSFFAYRPDPRHSIVGVGKFPSGLAKALAKHMKCRAFLEAVEAQEIRDLHEMLCLLYVAMTRAKYHMELILPKAAKKPTSSDNWIRQNKLIKDTLCSVQSPAPLPVEDENPHWQVLWQTTPLAEEKEVPSRQTTTRSQTGEIQTVLFAPSHHRRRLPRKAPSASEPTTSVTVRDLFMHADDTARRRGTAMHRMFEEIEWLEDFVPAHEDLQHILHQLQPTPSKDEITAWMDEFLRSLERAAVQKALRCPGPKECYQVLREHPFVVSLQDSTADAHLLEGIYDRVVLKLSKDRVVDIQLIDFKTGSAPKDGRMPPSYAKQLRAYQTALSMQHQLPQEHIHCHLLYVDSGVLMPL